MYRLLSRTGPLAGRTARLCLNRRLATSRFTLTQGSAAAVAWSTTLPQSHIAAQAQARTFCATTPKFHATGLDPAKDFAAVGSTLIPVINKLQEVFAVTGTDIDLPQIVVVGGQSSGKSSVLENLVGKDFLPRGTGIVTRRPLILQLNRIESGREHGEFAHLPGKKFSDFTKIRDEIVTETERLTGTNRGISTEPIILRIYSPNVLPLTLVDTPGITRVPVGDQPADIEQQIRSMVHDFISPDNAIILAVHAANQDIATSDALQMAKKLDPAGNRTIGVITKLDLMDGGTDAYDLLTGKVIPLKLGFIGVVNRGQMDIAKNKQISKSLKDERKYFTNHHIYSPIADRCGSLFLGQRCNLLLNDHISKELPRIKAEVREKLNAAETELMELGEAPGGNLSDKKWLVLQVLNKYCLDYKDVVEGNKTSQSTSTLHGGARIRYIFDEVFRKKLYDIKPTVGISVDEYRTAIRNAAGPRPALFVPEGAFEMLVKRQIKLLREPAIQCADLVQAELQRIANQLDHKDLNRFVVLRDQVNQVASKVLGDCLAPTRDMINKMVDCELAYINTNHPDFIGGAHGSLLRDGLEKHKDQSAYKPANSESSSSSTGFLGRIFGSKKSASASQKRGSQLDAFSSEEIPKELRINTNLTDREKIQIGLVKKLIESYFDIARKNMQDSVTKAIWHFLVNATEDRLHKALITELYQDGNLEKLLSEASHVHERRLDLQEEVVALTKAKRILQMAEMPSRQS